MKSENSIISEAKPVSEVANPDQRFGFPPAKAAVVEIGLEDREAFRPFLHGRPVNDKRGIAGAMVSPESDERVKISSVRPSDFLQVAK